jgi:hypothetical protein
MKYPTKATIRLLLFLISGSCYAMVYDNRFMPLFQRLWIAPDDGRSHALVNLFAVTGSRAYNRMSDEVPLPEIFGRYDLRDLANAAVAVGLQNPFKTEWIGESVPYNLAGNMQGQGLDIQFQKAFNSYVSVGFSCMAMRLHSWYDFSLKTQEVQDDLRKVSFTLKPGDVEELDELRRCIQQRLGFYGDHAHEYGIGDIDAYIRLGRYWSYVLKCTSVQAGVRCGLLVPTAERRNLHYPSWVPFGGDRHWGIYGALDAIFELKEDIKCGLYTRISKRFSRACCQRVPVSCEPDNFGALQTKVLLDPGATYVLSPFVDFECLRDGLGLRVFYTLTKHEADWWGVFNAPVAICTQNQIVRSSWGSDYFTVNVFYDFSKDRPDKAVYPIFTFCWDIPANVLVAETVAKTNKVSLGVEVSF